MGKTSRYAAAFAFAPLVLAAKAARADETPPTGPTILVHVSSPEPVAIERLEGEKWKPVCSSPCDVALPAEGSYRINGRNVRPSTPFRIATLARGERLDLEVDPASSDTHTLAMVVTLTGAVAFVPAMGYVALAVAGLAIAGIWGCPLYAAYADEPDYFECMRRVTVAVATKWIEYPIIWKPALFGAGLFAVGETWLALSPPTTVAPARVDPPSDLPHAFVFPIVRTTF